MENSKKSIILGVIVLVLTTLVLLGLTYAYYRTRIIGNVAEKSISITSKKLELTYYDGNELVDAGYIVPGDKFIKTFSVENTGEDKIEYGVYLENVINEFVNKDDLIITVNCESINTTTKEVSGICDGVTNYRFPLTNENILTNEISTGTTHNYSITVEYLKTDKDQTDDMDKLLSAKVNIYALTDVIDLFVDATNLEVTDTVELHSMPKTARLSEDKYKFVGVELGTHKLIIKDEDGNKKGETTLILKKGTDENVSGNSITISEETLSLRLEVNSISEGVINFANINTETYYVIEVNGQKYTKDEIKEAIEVSSKSNPAILTENVVVNKDLILDASDKDMYLDLGGYNLSCDYHCTDVLRINGINGSLTISNGQINAKNNMAAIYLGKGTTDELNLTLTIKDDVNVTAYSDAIDVLGMNTTLNFYGKIIVTGPDGGGIRTSGNWAGETINVYESAQITADGANSMAFYLPSLGVTNIYGGTFEGATVIGIKSGTLNITGGTFKAIGDKATLGSECLAASGQVATGDAIFIEINDRYKKEIKINIDNSATFISNKGNIIRTHACYVADLEAEENIIEVTGKYTNPITDVTNSLVTTYN